MPLGKPLLEALDRMGYGGLVLDTTGQVLIIINTGARLLHEDGGKDRRHSDPDWIRCALKSLLRSEGASRFRMDEDAWIVIRRNVGRKRPLILHAVPLAERSASGPHTVVILIDLDAAPQPHAGSAAKNLCAHPRRSQACHGDRPRQKPGRNRRSR